MEKLAIFTFLALLLSNISNQEDENTPLFHDGEVSDAIFIKLKTTDCKTHWFTDMELGEKYCWNHHRYEILSKAKKKLDTAMK